MSTPISEAVSASTRIDEEPALNKAAPAAVKPTPEPEHSESSDEKGEGNVAQKQQEEPEGAAGQDQDAITDVSYIVELAPGETVFLPFHWRLRDSGDGGAAEPLGALAPLEMETLLGARPKPHGAVFAAEAGLSHAVESGRASVDPSQPDDIAFAGGRVKIAGGSRLGVVAQLIVRLLPRPLVVDETIQLYGIEHAMLHASVPLSAERIPLWRNASSSTSSEAATSDLTQFRSWHVVCTDRAVGARISWAAADADSEGDDGAAEIQLQTRCGPAAATPRVCYLFIYANDAAPGRVSAVIQLMLNIACVCVPVPARLLLMLLCLSAGSGHLLMKTLPVCTGAVEYALCTRVTLGRRMRARCCCHPQLSPPSSVHVCDTTRPTRCSSLFNNKGLPIRGRHKPAVPWC